MPRRSAWIAILAFATSVAVGATSTAFAVPPPPDPSGPPPGPVPLSETDWVGRLQWALTGAGVLLLVGAVVVVLAVALRRHRATAMRVRIP
jgi:hypothetical protein